MKSKLQLTAGDIVELQSQVAQVHVEVGQAEFELGFNRALEYHEE
jgi:hypothetical protein